MGKQITMQTCVNLAVLPAAQQRVRAKLQAVVGGRWPAVEVHLLDLSGCGDQK